jgi:RNA polymerase sigma-70 factor (ECF subfamily)
MLGRRLLHQSVETTTTHSDAGTLLVRIGKGDASAVRPLIDAYGGFVWSIVRARFPGSQQQHDAEEVVQDVFASIWKDAARYDPDKGSEKTFIAVIARRRVVDRLRRNGNSHESAVGADQLDSQVDGKPVAGLTSDAEDVRKASQALESLPQPQRMVLRLFIVSGHTHEQISAATGVPLGTVKSHIRRGLARVREEVQAEGRQASGGVSQGPTPARGASS